MLCSLANFIKIWTSHIKPAVQYWSSVHPVVEQVSQQEIQFMIGVLILFTGTALSI